MHKFTTILLTAFLLGVPGASAKDVTIGMGNFEPYFIEDGNTGIFGDLIKAVFRHMPDHEPVFEYGYSNAGLWNNFQSGRSDAISNLFDSVELKGCRSDPIFRFRDVAITRASANIKINSVADLAGKSIVTFQGAKMFFGKEFANAVSSSAYEEIDKPKLQARMLHGNRAEVSVGDMFIFLHSLKAMNKSLGKPGDFVFNDIFPQIYSRMGFHDEKLCAAFNIALKKVRDSGEYERIYESYLEKLGFK